MRRRNEKALQLQYQKYMDSDKRMQQFLDTLSDREISMMTITWFAQKVGVSQSTVHHHREVYNRILEKR